MEYQSTDVVNYWTVFCFGEAERLMSLTDIKQVTFCIWVFWGCAAVGQCCVELPSRTILEMNFDPLSRATLQPTKELIANSPIVQFYTTPTRPQHLWSLPPSHLFSFWRSRVTKFSTSSFIAKKRHVTLVIGSVNPITSQPWHSLFKHWNTKRRN